MPKLRHIAIAAEDPEKMAEFYKKAFDFKEVGRPNGRQLHPQRGLLWLLAALGHGMTSLFCDPPSLWEHFRPPRGSTIRLPTG